MKSDVYKFKITFKLSASKQFETLNKNDQVRIKGKIEELKENQYPSGVKKLSISDNIFRIRVGKFRILYTLKKQKVTITILKIGQRRDIYKNI